MLSFLIGNPCSYNKKFVKARLNPFIFESVESVHRKSIENLMTLERHGIHSFAVALEREQKSSW
jgi:hypothetical protein